MEAQKIVQQVFTAGVGNIDRTGRSGRPRTVVLRLSFARVEEGLLRIVGNDKGGTG
jgi:hypothetical protein